MASPEGKLMFGGSTDTALISFVHVRCKQLWSNESSLSSTRFYKSSGPKTLLLRLLMMTAGQVWLTWALLTKKDTELSEQLQLDFSAPASQNRDTDLTECNDRQVCCWEHAPVINSWLRLLQSTHWQKYRGEQVLVHHAGKHFLNTCMLSTLQWSKGGIIIKSSTIVTFPGN